MFMHNYATAGDLNSHKTTKKRRARGNKRLFREQTFSAARLEIAFGRTPISTAPVYACKRGGEGAVLFDPAVGARALFLQRAGRLRSPHRFPHACRLGGLSGLARFESVSRFNGPGGFDPLGDFGRF
jgi:hypothetical protein